MRESKKIPVQVTASEWETTYHCDKCGKKIDPADWAGDTAHELAVWLDMEQCVNFFRRRDYCPDCVKIIWAGINELIGADPEAERDQEYD